MESSVRYSLRGGSNAAVHSLTLITPIGVTDGYGDPVLCLGYSLGATHRQIAGAAW
jgi:hypothetical protein